MTLQNPVIITPSLLPGVIVGDAALSIAYSPHAGDEGRTRYRWELIFDDGAKFFGEDLQSGCQGGSLQEGLESLLSFLYAAAESLLACERRGHSFDEDDNASLFPLPVVEWAAQYSDELSMLAYELEETPDLIVE